MKKHYVAMSKSNGNLCVLTPVHLVDEQPMFGMSISTHEQIGWAVDVGSECMLVNMKIVDEQLEILGEL